MQSLLPSTILSVIVHGILIAITLWALRGCERGAPAAPGGEKFRTVGLTSLPAEGSDRNDAPSPNFNDLRPAQDGEPEPIRDALSAVPDKAPSIDELLNATTATDSSVGAQIPTVIGPGAPLPGLPGVASATPLVRPPGSRTGGGSLTPGPGATTFMEITDTGRRFVYLIDTSASMNDGGRLKLARNQLKSSIRLLKPNQRFQVVFYGVTTTQMNLKRPQDRDLYPATVINIHKAEREIDRVRAEKGTEHKAALKHALRLKPDVIYFLTDGDEPRLTSADLGELLRLNSSNARVHVVEFASSQRESREVTWLQQLASRTGGKYSRVPVKAW